MTTADAAPGWRAGLDGIDAALVDGYQSGFPVEPRPFEAVGRSLGIDETEALVRVSRLYENGVFRRFGAVLNPPVIGSSILAAIKAPKERFEEIAGIVNGHRQVNHNYRRDHEWNMWFVVTAGSRDARDRILEAIETRTGCTVLRLPLVTDFYINLEFPVVNADRFAHESTAGSNGDGSTPGNASAASQVAATRVDEAARSDLSALEARVLLEIQDGLPLTRTPYADVARAIDAGTGDVIDAVSGLLAEGCIKRVGCVINHVVTGFDANCMVVWDVPDDRLEERGRAVGALPSVTLCYHRPRRSALDWPYNLFTMIHGRDPDAVAAKIDDLGAEHLPYEHERLRSTETLKQTGARYDALLAD